MEKIGNMVITNKNSSKTANNNNSKNKACYRPNMSMIERNRTKTRSRLKIK